MPAVGSALWLTSCSLAQHSALTAWKPHFSDFLRFPHAASSLGVSPFSHGLKGCHTLSCSSESCAPRLLIVKSIFFFFYFYRKRAQQLSDPCFRWRQPERFHFAGEPSWTTFVVTIQEGTSLKRDIFLLYQTCFLHKLFVICEGQSTRIVDYREETLNIRSAA